MMVHVCACVYMCAALQRPCQSAPLKHPDREKQSNSSASGIHIGSCEQTRSGEFTYNVRELTGWGNESSPQGSVTSEPRGHGVSPNHQSQQLACLLIRTTESLPQHPNEIHSKTLLNYILLTSSHVNVTVMWLEYRVRC